MSAYVPRAASPDPPPRKRALRDEKNGIGAAVPSWLRLLREAGYDLRRIPEPQRSAVATALKWRGIILGV